MIRRGDVKALLLGVAAALLVWAWHPAPWLLAACVGIGAARLWARSR
jgi:hypothetical protein